MFLDRKKTLKKTRIKFYNTLALPVLLYGSETWTIKARNARRITAAEMKYMRRTAGYSWTDYKTNAQIAKELKITPILDKLLEYKRNWIQHVNRMPRNRLPRVMKHYSPNGRRNHGRPLKRLLDTGQQVAQLHDRYMMMMMMMMIINAILLMHYVLVLRVLFPSLDIFIFVCNLQSFHACSKCGNI